MIRTHPARTRVLVITGDVLGAKMAGPAIRAWEMARTLHESCEVRLVSTQACTISQAGFLAEMANEAALKRHVHWCEVLIFQGYTLSVFPWIRRSNAVLVADLYDPMHLEYLEQDAHAPPAVRAKQHRYISEVLEVQLELADYFICASEKQRDFWLGQLASAARISPNNYDRDASLRSLIDVVPFGLPATPAKQRRHAIRGTIPGIEQQDQVIIWGGGVYNWFDPLTLIRAIAMLAPDRPRLRLYFLGMTHPNPEVPAMHMATAAMRLADELHLTNRHVFFHREWVDYEDRANYLLDADLGVSTHFAHVETAFSFRTRVLDYLWAGLPIVCTEGDAFAELIREHKLGAAVPPNNVEALASALASMLYGTEYAATAYRVREFSSSMTWPRALAPLVRFCVEPRHAADRVRSGGAPESYPGTVKSRAFRVSPILLAFQGALSRIRHTVFWRRTETPRKWLNTLRSLR